MRYITIIRGNSSVTGYKGKGIIIDDDKPIQLTDQADDNLIREYGLSLIDKFLNPEKNKMLRNLSDLCNVGIRSLQMMWETIGSYFILKMTMTCSLYLRLELFIITFVCLFL